MTDVNGWSIVLEKRLDERKGSYGTLFSKTRIHLLIFFLTPEVERGKVTDKRKTTVTVLVEELLISSTPTLSFFLLCNKQINTIIGINNLTLIILQSNRQNLTDSSGSTILWIHIYVFATRHFSCTIWIKGPLFQAVWIQCTSWTTVMSELLKYVHAYRAENE